MDSCVERSQLAVKLAHKLQVSGAPNFNNEGGVTYSCTRPDISSANKE